MTIWDKIKFWFLFNQDKIVLVAVILLIPLFFIMMDYQYDKEKPINYDRYLGRTKLIKLEYKELFGPATYGSSKPVLNGLEIQFQYLVNSVQYSNTIFIDSHGRSKIKDYIYENQKDSLEVCYDITYPNESRLHVKQKKFNLPKIKELYK